MMILMIFIIIIIPTIQVMLLGLRKNKCFVLERLNNTSLETNFKPRFLS